MCDLVAAAKIISGWPLTLENPFRDDVRGRVETLAVLSSRLTIMRERARREGRPITDAETELARIVEVESLELKVKKRLALKQNIREIA